MMRFSKFSAALLLTIKATVTIGSNIATTHFCASVLKAGEHRKLPHSDVIRCLSSFPFHRAKALAFLDYILPLVDLQSTIAYLKDPPPQHMFPAVDILGGIEKIREKILRAEADMYVGQFQFEADLHWLLNIAPRDGHFYIPLPLVSAFAFGTELELVSISKDGFSLPEVFVKDDLKSHAGWEPSPIASVSGQPVSAYLQRISQSGGFHDADALYNGMFCKIPFRNDCGGFLGLSHYRETVTDSETVLFQNGSTRRVRNIGMLLDKNRLPFSSGLPKELDPLLSSYGPPTSSLGSVEPGAISLHSRGYTAGYFLPDSSTAVLVIACFGTNKESVQEQQVVLQDFLARCSAAGKKRLIVDLRDNGGGSIFAGYDAFKQLFPKYTPYGATRYRLSPFIDYVGSILSAAKIDFGYFSVKAELREDLIRFTNWDQMGAPQKIHGDSFTPLLRWNLLRPALQNGNGITVSGYGDRKNLPKQVFEAKNMVLLHNGYCASMCALFSEFMKMQGQVRSVAIGGRPQFGAIQGIGGTKGGQVLSYGDVMAIRWQLDGFINVAEDRGKGNKIRPPPPARLMPPVQGRIQGIRAVDMRFNFRNNYREKDDAQTPLQFVYEAANCRLFYKEEDVLSALPLWKRVTDVAWGNGTCVGKSTTNGDEKIGEKVTDAVPFHQAVKPEVIARAGLF